ncbi:uncharacterized protein LOC108110476 [Drosophila eugracilis]|uniref:uncharacterized protein LOC108110476 n=1 Tax=Drosophila eugracilis TaxID=29029 RepID=UPI001BDA2128|nr:uncharacterized protein LOC108110476 [Drosophila eugracilis]
MSAAKNNRLSLSFSQEFKLMRSEYEVRVTQLEKEVYECCRILNKIPRTEDDLKSSTSRTNHSENTNLVLWEFNMQGIPVENISIQLRDNHVYLKAFKKNRDIEQDILMPQNADKSKITATLRPHGTLTISAPIFQIPDY